MKSNLFITLILKTALVFSFFQMGLVAHAEPGFRSPLDPSLPEGVREAAQSVFKIYNQGGSMVRAVSRDQFEGELTTLKADATKWWQRAQIDFCKEAGKSQCAVYSHMGFGSAFLLERGDRLLTNLHNFQSSTSSEVRLMDLTSKEKIQIGLQNLPLFMGLEKNDGSPVISETTNPPRLSFFNPDPRLHTDERRAMNTVLGRLSDWVEAVLPTPIGKPLHVASREPQPGDTLYVIGFPKETTTRAALGTGDSNGSSQYVSVGKVLTIKEWREKTGSRLGALSEMLFERMMIFGDFDCEEGNSGGPVVDASGRVVAILMAGYDDQTRTPSTRICGALKVTNQESLKDLWDALAKP